MLAYFNQSKNEVNFYEADVIQSNGVFTLVDNKVNIKQSKSYYGCMTNKQIMNVPKGDYIALIYFEGYLNNIEFADSYATYKEAVEATPNKLRFVIENEVGSRQVYEYPIISTTDNMVKTNKFAIVSTDSDTDNIYLELVGSDVEYIASYVMLFENNHEFTIVS